MHECAMCRKSLPSEAFRSSTRMRYGRKASSRCSYCKNCEREWNATRRNKDKRKASLAARRWNGGRGDRRPKWLVCLERLGSGYGQAIAAKRKSAPVKIITRKRMGRTIPMLEYVGRLLVEDQSACELSHCALEFKARYRFDEAFRIKEIERRRARKAAAYIVGDGTLNADVIRRLFIEATHCTYCEQAMGPRDKSLDHVIPLSKGGRHSLSNVVIACKTCNTRKQARTPEEWRAAG